ncbi:histidine--tRNA ligase [[Clostridium] symbiosum]|uniref:histidine--tRNA ligase n=1 Tax=Clostridium symbiosum TaxID=1512 RepID=UPI001D088499|nr:histidine--tRNA ligase [[Clostridium] symbiosum]MCB6609526.1 histidine--tRNA ligase [[Clostridium] symbiosum]MCB6929481.1 histidine--tRNA ligase [[Clostridium] symbiosum]
MALKKKPVTGMKDVLPAEMELRDYVLNIIKDTYRGYGFSSIETPCVEHIENLTSKQGGDNEKLIFKILKRGEKLNLETAETDADLVEEGLRYDLTVPLCRYYSNNAANLTTPFKALQVGSVWRADKPQKGRFRQFVQCDIDVLGDGTNLVEIETILAITKTLTRICPDKAFTVRVNDRAILKGMADYSGFPEDETDRVFIILDKMDKIGLNGVAEELLEAGYAKEAVDKYTDLLANIRNDADGVRALGEKLASVMDPEKAENLAYIMETVSEINDVECGLEFDPTLVRGMGYYTGTIFEVSMEGFGGSVAGGGRYDKLIGKFTGVDTPACGISIGFERIITILMESGFKIPSLVGKKVFLFEKNLSKEQFKKVLQAAQEERAKGVRVAVAQMNKNKKFQKEQLMKEGFEEFVEFYKDSI